MKIAIVGVRGIPVIYSGFETFAEKLATDFVKKGHKVNVYCRKPYVNSKIKVYKGITLKVFPVIKHKNFETFTHSLLSTLDICIKRNCDLVYYMGVGSAIFALFPRLFGIKTAVNVDGLDWKREKWGLFARAYLNLSEFLSTLIPHILITDSFYIKNYYQRKYKKDSYYFPYGYFKSQNFKTNILNQLKLKKNNYFVWVGRLVPENHLEDFIFAFKKLKTNIKCLIIGSSYYEDCYKKKILAISQNDSRIIFTGFVKRKDFAVLVQNALAYIETKISGGTHPSLVEAMGIGCLIVSNDYPSNKQILGSDAIFYKNKSSKSLLVKLNLIKNKCLKNKTTKIKIAVKQRAIKYYTWKKIIDDYEILFKKFLIQ